MDIGTGLDNVNWCLKKCGGIAVLMITGKVACNGYSGTTIASGYRPKIESNASIWINDGAGNRYNGYIILSTAGAIKFYFYKPHSTEVGECTSRSDLYPHGQVCYCLA